MKLLIVESPSKAKHIGHFLGSGWRVMASQGHIRDLEKTGDSSYVRPPEFKMNYTIDDRHKSIVSSLKSAAAQADTIYLATDPDREGEAIAWHLCQVLKINPREALRVTYQEVTETAVKAALASPRKLNMSLVAAQEVRRGLDRMVGWEVSGALSRMIDAKASAGRVQTPALRLIVEREQEIRRFVAVHWYQVIAKMAGGWKATWQDGTLPDQYFQDEGFAQRLASAVPTLPFKVIKSESKPAKRSPSPPFTSSSLQADGSRALKCGTEDIMKAAQSLFEAGLITYHRTDSPNLSQEGEQLLRGALTAKGRPVVPTPRRWKSKGGAQEAHEAIRPVDPTQENAGADELQRAVYQLILLRALASQMPDAIYQRTSCTLDGGPFEGRETLFRATGSVLTDPGWQALYRESIDDESVADDDDAGNPVPQLTEGSEVRAQTGEAVAKMTKPPARLNEATLTEALEKAEIGRPSTYVSIIKTLYAREYMERKGKAPALYPTAIGEAVIEALAGRFEFADVAWTRQVEQDLDLITQGEAKPHSTLQKVWDSIQSSLSTLPAGSRGASSQVACPINGCAGHVRRLESKNSKGFYFWVCDTKAHEPLRDNDGKPGEQFPPKGEAKPQAAPTGDEPPCPKCKVAVTRQTTASGKPYFRCQKCKSAWWPDFSNGAALGNKWAK